MPLVQLAEAAQPHFIVIEDNNCKTLQLNIFILTQDNQKYKASPVLNHYY